MSAQSPGRMLLDAQLRTTRSVSRMAGGSIEGRAEVAAPLPDPPRAVPYKVSGGATELPFHYSGSLVVGDTSDRRYVPDYTVITRAMVTASTAPTGSSFSIEVLLNGTVYGTIGLVAGDYADVDNLTPFAIEPLTDYVQLRVASVGTTTPGAGIVVLLLP